MPLITTLANSSARGYGGLQTFGGAGTSYESIATLTPTTSTFSFTGIPSTYKHLQVRVLARTSVGGSTTNINMRLNSDTGNNFVQHVINATGSSVSAGFSPADNQVLGLRVPGSVASSDIFGIGIIDIIDYANTNKYKTVRTITGHDNNGSGEIFYTSILWMSTSAISEINFLCASSLVTGSSFALYGIKGA